MTHDNVISIYEVVEDAECPFFIMQLIEGPSLKQFLAHRQRVQPELAALLASQISDGLQAAHVKNLIHRDVKPGNVLLEPIEPQSDEGSEAVGYRAKLIDFGLARQIDGEGNETSAQLFAGTLAYMSPEQITSPQAIDSRTDVYSLGMTLYQMLTGYQPFHGSPHQVIRKIESVEPPLPRSLNESVPRDLESICLKAIQKDPARRYQSMPEVKADLQRFLDGRPTVARPISALETSTRWVKRNPRIAWLSALFMSSLVALTLGAIGFAVTVNRKNLQLAQQRSLTTESKVRRVLDAAPGSLRLAITDLEATEEFLNPLVSAKSDPNADIQRRLKRGDGAQYPR